MTTELMSEELLAQRDALVADLCRRLSERGPNELQRCGGSARAESDLREHLACLAEAIDSQSPALFVHHVSWVRSLHDAVEVDPDCLRIALDLIAERLPEYGGIWSAAEPCLRQARAELERPAHPDYSLVDADAPHGDLARAYLEALLAANRHEAGRLVLDALNRGVDVRAIYLDVFQPVQREIGRLWQINEISVAQEHYATAVTQFVMSQLYPRIFSGHKNGVRMVALSASKELHEIGIRMVADFFELSGWDTYYLGANTPPDGVAEAIERHEADLLAVSATMMIHLREVRQMIAAVRAAGLDHIVTLVGGYPFNVVPDLWKRVGADGWAPDAAGAVTTAERLVNNGNPR